MKSSLAPTAIADAKRRATSFSSAIVVTRNLSSRRKFGRKREQCAFPD
jgi:hypothetical protein